MESQAHYVTVEMEINGFTQSYLDLKMPVWTPGSYLVREYARHVENIQAFSGKESITCRKVSKNTWRIANPQQHVKIRYDIYGFEPSVRTNFIDCDHAFLSPAATFLYIAGHIDQPATIRINLPSSWSKISTGLSKLTTSENSFYAPNFDVLFDSPIEVGNQDIWHFEASGVRHEVAMVGRGNYDRQQLTEDIRKIVEAETHIWGENPNADYVFITHHSQSGYGGLEHHNSAVLAINRNAYRNESNYKAFLGLVAHEYFHLWNVKRLRPKALGPFDYDAENYTTSLWIMEGFTSYYDNLVLRRCGFYTVQEYLNVLANDFNAVYSRPGYRVQSAASSSFDTWIKQYRPDENSINSSISYYNKGAMLAAALDINIIAGTDGRLRLDDVLREAYRFFYKQEGRGFEEWEFQSLAQKVTGVDLSAIFEAAHSVDELDYNIYFRAVGYEYVDLNEDNKVLILGVRTAVQENKIIVKNVERGSGAWDAGLNVNDELIAIDGHRLDVAGKVLDFVLEHAEEDSIVDVLIARDGLMRTIHTPLRRSLKPQWHIQEKADATADERYLGRIWLSVE